MELQDEIDRLSSNVHRHAETEEFGGHLELFLGKLTELVNETDSMTVMTGALEAAYLLGRYPSEERIWEWVAARCRGANDQQKEALRIAFLELIPEKPVNLASLERLWRLDSEKATRWAVISAYRGNRKRMENDRMKLERIRMSTARRATMKLRRMFWDAVGASVQEMPGRELLAAGLDS